MKNIRIPLSILFVFSMLFMIMSCLNEPVKYVSIEINNDTADELVVSCKINASISPTKDKTSDKVCVSAHEKKQ